MILMERYISFFPFQDQEEILQIRGTLGILMRHIRM